MTMKFPTALRPSQPPKDDRAALLGRIAALDAGNARLRADMDDLRRSSVRVRTALENLLAQLNEQATTEIRMSDGRVVIGAFEHALDMAAASEFMRLGAPRANEGHADE